MGMKTLKLMNLSSYSFFKSIPSQYYLPFTVSHTYTLPFKQLEISSSSSRRQSKATTSAGWDKLSFNPLPSKSHVRTV